MKQKIALLLIVQALVLSLASFLLSTSVSAAAYTTKLECATNVTTITANAPSSVVTNSAFSVTNITSTSTAPSGITINKIVSTSNVSNASPSVVTGTWTGTGTGTFTVPFPDIALTATGAAGSQVKVSLASIAIYINGNTTNPIITCNQANGQLTANKPGESLTLLSLPITAPTVAPTTTNNTTTTAPTSTTPKTSTTSKPTTTTTTPTTTPSSSPAPTTTATASSSPTQPVTITVLDASGNPISNVPVKVDDSAPTPTNDQGTVTYLSLAAGTHTVTVLGKNTKITRTINLTNGSAPTNLTIQMPRLIPLPLLVGAISLGTLVVGSLLFWLYRRHKGTLHIRRVVPLNEAIQATIITGASSGHMTTPPQAVQPLPAAPTVALASSVPTPSVSQTAVAPMASSTLASLTPAQEQYLSAHQPPAQPGQVITPHA